MQIVIEISDSVYDAIKNKYTLVNPKEGTLIKTLWDAVENGTPLPKGHGRLIDADRLKEVVHRNTVFDLYDEFVDMQPTIIEADRSEKGEKE